MSRKLITLIIALICCITISAQDTDSITVSYSHPENDFLNQLLNFQEIDALIMKLASTKKCDYNIDFVEYDNGKITRQQFSFQKLKLSPDTVTINLFAMPTAGDSIKIGTWTHWDNIGKMPFALLIETLPLDTYTPGDTIPLAAYSQGIKRTFEFNGKPSIGYDICGVRYSKKPVADWGKEFKFEKYYWFELVPVHKKE